MKKRRFDKTLVVSAYGVKVEIRTNEVEALPPIRKVLRRNLPGCEFLRSRTDDTHVFHYSWNPSEKDSLRDNEEWVGHRMNRRDLIELLGSRVRLTVAEHATLRVFIHAGAVGWKGLAIVIPARSFKGKSTLTAELVKLGARYYSDEYAVLDKSGRLHPFPKKLSLRGIKNDHEQVEIAAASLGGTVGKRPIPVGAVIVTEFKKGAKWKPKIIASGEGAMSLIDNAVPIRRDPRFAISIIGKVAAAALFLKSKRGEAAETAADILRTVSENRYQRPDLDEKKI